MSAAPSYDPRSVTTGGLTGEIARLEAQAELTFSVELEALHDAGLAADGCLVDLGCGTGAVTRRLRAARPGSVVIGADVDVDLIALVDAPTVLIENDRCPLPAAEADDVLVRYVGQHLQPAARIRLWQEAKRLLRPGGRLHVVDVADDDWGRTRPFFPSLVEVYSRVAEHQRQQGGSRFVVHALPAELTAAGFTDVRTRRTQVSSADRPVRDFAVHLGPQRYAFLLATGVLSLTDLARVTQAWQRLVTAPDAFVALAVHVVSGCTPCPSPRPRGTP